MPCLIALLALIAPRLTIIGVFIFSDYLGRAYETWIWPLLGFFFLPLTTLAYAWAVNAGGVEGFRLAVIVLAVLLDLGFVGAGAESRRSKW